uniref:Uncharacterized protein n=1 Tax=mine drainage metagenome TaxID=410659 RepID=E6Q4X2_9ZZZZ
MGGLAEYLIVDAAKATLERRSKLTTCESFQEQGGVSPDFMIHQARGVCCRSAAQPATPSGPALQAGAPILFTGIEQFWLRH